MDRSPEHARGDTATIDARSDIHSAMVLCHELIRHDESSPATVLVAAR